MRGCKITLPVLIFLGFSVSAFCQTEAIKSVVNNLAFYKQKHDLKFLGNAKKSVDSLISADPDDLQKNVYKVMVNASILYLDSLNKLNQPSALFEQTTDLTDKLLDKRKLYRYQPQMDYTKECLANVYIRKAFVYLNNSDFINALQLFERARNYSPDFKPLRVYIAYANHKLGNIQSAAKNYAGLIGDDSMKPEYVLAASTIYKSFGDTVTALEIVKKARKLLPNDKSLLMEEANIYNNKRDYQSLAPLLPALLDINVNNADIAFVSANCYDHLNQYEKAEPLYLQSIALNSSAYGPIFNLGLLYLKQEEIRQEGSGTQNVARAIQWLQKANEISPNNISCLKALQLAYTKTGNTNQINRIDNTLKQLTNQ